MVRVGLRAIAHEHLPVNGFRHVGKHSMRCPSHTSVQEDFLQLSQGRASSPFIIMNSV